MYLKSLRLENIACFEELYLDFTDENGEPCRWVVLLGENGTGKTTILTGILQALNLAWLGKSRRKENYQSSAAVFAVPTSKYDKYIIPSGEEIGLEWFSDGGASFISDIYSRISIGESVGWFIGGYGSKRRMNSSIDDKDLSTPYTGDGKRVLSLHSQDHHLTPLKAWLSNLEYESLKLGTILQEPKETKIPTVQGHRVVRRYSDEEREEASKKFQKVEAEFTRAVRAIERILPEGITFVEVTSDKDVLFEENGVCVSLDVFSDGYQSTMAWVGDLVRRLCEAFPDMENPLEASGVVLVDEIDLHLHPRWQREIVQKIRNTFPNLQFIVTTHSPFIVQDMTEKDKIIVLTRDGDKVTAREQKGFVQNWRAGQILTSWLFGLPTEFDVDIEKELVNQQELADRKAQGLLTEEEREELRQVTEFLSTLPSEETGAELLSQDYLDREAVRKAAATALKLLRKVEGK